jgi:hypothetical protein
MLNLSCLALLIEQNFAAMHIHMESTILATISNHHCSYGFMTRQTTHTHAVVGLLLHAAMSREAAKVMRILLCASHSLADD